MNFRKIRKKVYKIISLLDELFERKVFANLMNLRHFLKISLFKSPLDEYKNFKFKYIEIKSKIFYFTKVKNKPKINTILLNKKDKFKKYGHETFNNKIIEKNSLSILEKLKKINNPWKDDGTYSAFAINDFKEEFINIFRNEVDDLLKNILNSDYQIFSHQLYRSIRNKNENSPQGSQLWHWDGGPTSCINLMICLTPVNSDNGSMRSISWNYSKKIHLYIFDKYRKRIKSKRYLNSKKLSRIDERSIKCSLINDYITINKVPYFQPISEKSGLVYLFKNNLVHAGGFGEKINKERIVSVFHIYPSIKLTSLNQKFENIPISNKPYPEI